MQKKWIKKISGTNEKVKLICLPHAGAGGIIYTPWKGILSESIGLYVVLLPGREKRIREELEPDAVKLCSEILDGIEEELAEPYVLFGHSMGGILVYEMLKQMIARKLPLPQRLVMAASSLKGFKDVPNVDLLSDDELAKFLAKMGGTEEEILYNENFRECYFPIIRNDYKLVRTYVFEPIKIPVPVLALYGINDDHVELENMKYYQELTDDFELVEMEENHFFIEDGTRVCGILNDRLLNIT